MKKRKGKLEKGLLTRREFIKKSTLVGAGLAATGSLFDGTPPAFAQKKEGIVRVWGEPGPYAAVAVDGMNEWAAKNAPKLKFELEIMSWDIVYMKLMTDLSAGRPANCISVESPIAFQLMAEGLLEPVDDLILRIGPKRLIPGAEWWYWGAWKGRQYVIPAHHQSHLLVVRMDIIKDLGLSNPDTWDWNDLLNAAKTIKEKKKKMSGITLALGRNLCTEYHFASFLYSAGGRMFDVKNNFQVVFDSPATIEALEYLAELSQYMPKGAVGYSFLDCVDSMVTGETAMTYYWGRVFGRAAEEAPEIFKNIEAFLQPRHPKTGLRTNWNDFQGWLIPKQNNPYIKEVKEALVHYQTGTKWLIRYVHSLVPNVSPVYKDVVEDRSLYQHPFFNSLNIFCCSYFWQLKCSLITVIAYYFNLATFN